MRLMILARSVYRLVIDFLIAKMSVGNYWAIMSSQYGHHDILALKNDVET